MRLSDHEIELLEIMVGRRPAGPWGAWVTACLESLVGSGLVEKDGPNYFITDAGRAVLKGEQGD